MTGTKGAVFRFGSNVNIELLFLVSPKFPESSSRAVDPIESSFWSALTKPDANNNDDQFHIYVSQDGYHEGVKNVAESFGKRVKLFQRERKIVMPAVPIGNNPAYYSLAQHYKFAIDQV